MLIFSDQKDKKNLKTLTKLLNPDRVTLTALRLPSWRRSFWARWSRWWCGTRPSASRWSWRSPWGPSVGPGTRCISGWPLSPEGRTSTGFHHRPFKVQLHFTKDQSVSDGFTLRFGVWVWSTMNLIRMLNCWSNGNDSLTHTHKATRLDVCWILLTSFSFWANAIACNLSLLIIIIYSNSFFVLNRTAAVSSLELLSCFKSVSFLKIYVCPVNSMT